MHPKLDHLSMSTNRNIPNGTLTIPVIYKLVVAGFIIFNSMTCSVNFKTEFKNYESDLADSKTASISGDGLMLYLVGAEKKLHDYLRLDQGEYLIGFWQPASRLSGVARCRVQAGLDYKINVVDRKILKKSQSTTLIGECVIRDP